MNFALPTKIQKLIRDRVRSGRYQNATEVVTAAMANLDQQERIAKLSRSELELVYPGASKKLAEGLAAARAGKMSDGKAFFKQLERETKKPTTKRRKSA